MSYIASFDIGTTNIKGILVCGKAVVHNVKNRPIDVITTDGCVEQEPEAWYQAVAAIAQEWFREGIRPDEIKLISFSGQMQDCIPVSAEGTPVRPAILYSDGRGVEQSKRLLEKLGEEAIIRETANHMDGTLTLPKIMWLQEHEPHAYSEAASFLISSKDYVISRLTGAFVTDPTSAATTGCMNLQTRTWMEEWLKQLDMEAEKFPLILPPDAEAGQVHKRGSSETGFSEGTPVLCGIGDAGAATLGAGVYREGEAYAYIGTTGWVAAASERYMDVQNGAFNLAYVVPGRQISIAPLTNAGSAHKWAAQVFGPGTGAAAENFETDRNEDGDSLLFAELESALEKTERGSGVLFLPYLNGERCPVQDVNASGSFVGLRTTTTKGQMGLAVLEGVALAIRQVMSLIVKPEAKLRISLIGGGAKSQVWCQILADVLQCELVVPDDSHYLPSIGAAMLGFPKMGWSINVEEICARVKAAQQVKSYYPNPELADYYNKQFEKYNVLYAQLAPLFAM
ncbi:xylulokinase [Paenibacillus senegalensis]|uniref:xylulokinase n=1 Tax=Paenibacillus senegalensis TaxID=1465766 RepID=UPI00028914B2|nr:FGGY family carbohydrate kinase [Paenibacillus senegalensis]